MDYNTKADFLKAIANPSRLAILDNLEEEGCNVGKMVENLEIPQSTVSQHLGILRKQKIVTAHKDGYNTCYRITDKRVKEILAVLKK
ncbi:MAG: metalloregulator ArsR/SmtB family transcription factor [Spirochaetes bacterium]|nr:metalloregulator ArsR/SmtB family transcription factor [Spirochaetota bacterium]